MFLKALSMLFYFFFMTNKLVYNSIYDATWHYTGQHVPILLLHFAS